MTLNPEVIRSNWFNPMNLQIKGILHVHFKWIHSIHCMTFQMVQLLSKQMHSQSHSYNRGKTILWFPFRINRLHPPAVYKHHKTHQKTIVIQFINEICIFPVVTLPLPNKQTSVIQTIFSLQSRCIKSKTIECNTESKGNISMSFLPRNKR